MNQTPKRKRPCRHPETVLNTTGGMHFSAGEVWDDLEDHVVCKGCGHEVNKRGKPQSLHGHNAVWYGFRDMVTEYFSKGGNFQRIPF